MISGDGWGLRFPDIRLIVEEKPRKNLNQENWPDRGSNPVPLGERQRRYPSTTAVALLGQKEIRPSRLFDHFELKV